MSEKLNSTPDKPASHKLEATNMTDEQLAVLAEAYAKAEGSKTPMAEVRSTLSDSEAFSFKDVYEMNNIELKAVAAEAGQVLGERQREARISELEQTLAVVDGKTTYADKRQALSAHLGFKRVYEMNNLEINDFLADTERQLAELKGQPEAEAEGDDVVAPTSQAERLTDTEPTAYRAPRLEIDDDETEVAETPVVARRVEIPTDDSDQVTDQEAAADSQAESASDDEELDDTESVEGKRRGRIKRAWRSFSKSFDRASAELGLTLTEAAHTLNSKWGNRRSGETDAEFERRQQKKGKAAIYGLVAVAAASLAYKLGADIDVMPDAAGNGRSGAAEAQAAGSVDRQPVEMKTEVATKLYDREALRVEPGEGLNQTMRELGIPKRQWSGILDRVGSQLHDMHLSDGNRVTYFDQGANEWRLNLPKNGRLPKEALDLIDQARR